MLECARAEALFVSLIQRSDPYSAAAVREAVRRSVGRHGSRGCAALVAHEYGEHPDVAVGRMSWALDTVRGAFPTVAPAMTMPAAVCRGRAPANLP
ncbi:MAG: hypothetical protein QOI74_2473 [Micromonosporaceae bacterium]|jgi:hypothetical protein|nr:hypothetical protein [Micromonosporaceae bacterium]MDT5035102.1 hypothetical protein [Micromonosporaceae bacterium]